MKTKFCKILLAVRSYEMNTEDQRMLLFLYLIGLTERR